MYELERITVEIICAILSFILVRFMIKPYGLTREARFLGLSIGFALFGISNIVFGTGILFSNNKYLWLSIVIRSFATIFIAYTYYFSKKPSKNTRLYWDVSLGVLIVAFLVLCLLVEGFPKVISPYRDWFNGGLKIIDLIGITYICIHLLRRHIKNPTPITIWIPIAYALLGISQYSLLIRTVEGSDIGPALIGGLIFRLAGLGLFLVVSYLALYKEKKGYE